MQSKNIAQLLAGLEKSTEADLQFCISTLQNLDEKTLLQPSQTGGWSIAQCLDHLNSYGHFYLPQIIIALDKSSSSSSAEFKSGWFGNYFVNMMQDNSGKKYSAFKGHIPAQDLNAAAVVAEFIRQQEQFLELLRVASNRNLNVRVPVSVSKLIRLKVGDVFRFVSAHNRRHINQAKRNL